LPDLGFAPLAPFWAAAQEGQLSLPKCCDCAKITWYPAESCPQCSGSTFEWKAVSGKARLFSWAIVSRALHRPLAPLGPYISAIVAIEEDPSVRLVTRLVDCDAKALTQDMPVRLKCADAGYPEVETGFIVPFFTPAKL